MRPEISQAIQLLDTAFTITDDFDVTKHNGDFEEFACYVIKWYRAIQDKKSGPRTPIMILKERYTQRDFLKKQMAQAHKIDIDKWCEGERIHGDPGPDYTLHWAVEHNQEFREKFFKSRCRTCSKCIDCGNECKEECENYEPELYDETVHIIQKFIQDLKLEGAIGEKIKAVCAKYKIQIS